jgi:hypothetical protein
MDLIISTGLSTILLAKHVPLNSNRYLSGMIWYLIFYTILYWGMELFDNSYYKQPSEIRLRTFLTPYNFYILGTLWVLIGAMGLTSADLVVILLYSVIGYYANEALALCGMNASIMTLLSSAVLTYPLWASFT